MGATMDDALPLDKADYYGDDEELKAITSTLCAYLLYRRTAHRNMTHRRRTSFYLLPRTHQEALQAPPISYLKTLDNIDQAIEHNAAVSEAIYSSAAEAFGVDIGAESKKALEDKTTGEDVDKVRSTLKQFYRDWSTDGAEERAACYGPVMDELEARFGYLDAAGKSEIRVVIPGAGLGRLAFDIAVAGYTSQGNEFSYHQLMASNFILNHSTSANEFNIHPFISSFSNHRSRANQLRSVSIPDVHPAALLSTPSIEIGGESPGDRFSMIAGDFLSCYSDPGSTGSFDVCATVFFIDTAPNICAYLATIHNLLAPGGLWINFGPLLWHYEDVAPPKREGDEGSVELALDEVLVLVEMSGFKVVKRGSGRKTPYIGDGLSLLTHTYESEFWVAEKV